MIAPAGGLGTRFRRLWERIATVQGVTTAAVLLGCGALVLYPVLFLIEESLNTGDPIVFPAEQFGLGNYLDLVHDLGIVRNTVLVAFLATAMAVGFGFVLAWILSRTDVPGRRLLERLMELPYYVTPLVGALAWSILAGPKNGFLNQLWHLVGGQGDLFNIHSAFGIAWVMAFFEGTVAFMMISAAMKSMDPALEESARVLGGSKLRTMLRITLPLVTPAVLGATVFVFAEMLGAFAAALVLGIPARFYVITTAIYESTFSYPPDYAKAAAMGIALFAVMFVTLSIYRRIVTRGVHTTITGKAFRPRVMAMRRWRWMLVGICWAYVFVAVILPLGALLLTSFQRFATVILPGERLHAGELPDLLADGPRPLGAGQQRPPGRGRGDRRGADHNRPGVDHLPLARAGPGRHRVLTHVSPGGPPYGLRARALVGVVEYPGAHLRHAVAAGPGLLHGAPSARRANDGGSGPADRSQPGRVRPDVRRLLGLPTAHRDGPPAAPRDRGHVAAVLHGECPGAGCVDLPHGTEQQGHRTLHRELVDELGDGADGRHGHYPERDRAGGAGDHALQHARHLGRAPVVNHFRMSQGSRAPADAGQRDDAATGGQAKAPAPRDSAPCIEVADLLVRYGDIVAVNGVSFTVRRGEHLTLLGPSGCGKTTTLRAIAGLEQPASGSIRVDGKPVFSSADGFDVPAEKRGISMVFQSYAVWPHMSVFNNVAYGLRVRRLDPAIVAEKVEWALDLVHMRGYGQRSAAKLSGGQQQRVALARAIAFSPNVVLFDEPLSNLDAKLRAEMRVELRELQRRLDITSVYVTHDQEEALAISDRVIVMNEGRIEQIGTSEEIYNQPRSRFVADFVGSANLIAGRVRGDSREPGPIAFEMTGGVLLQAHALHAPRGDETQVAVRTAYITLGPPGPPGGANAVAGSIRQRLFHGDFIQYIVDWPAGQLVIRRPPTDVFEEGIGVVVSFAPEHCILLEG